MLGKANKMLVKSIKGIKKSVFILVFLLLESNSLWAVDLELTQGVNSALPIGINSFGKNPTGREFSKILQQDLAMSGRFKVLELAPQLEGNFVIEPWRQLGADHVVSGNLTILEGNQFEINFEIRNALGQNQLLLSRNYKIKGSQLRALAHHISDQVYEKLTGERGIFSTKIAYILVQRGRQNSTYYLDVADIDGYNSQHLLVSSEPVMSPSWSPDGRQIAYVSFEKKKAQIYTVDVETGHRRLLTAFSGINGAPAWSPDGRELAVVLSKAGSPKIYSVDLTSGKMKQLTFGDAIDTEPRYSPDGKSLLFTSGRGGAPQIYKLNLANGQVSRVTYEGNYNARASYTPDQKRIVMLHRAERDFNIAVQEQNGLVTPLTFSPADESPSLAPNGRLVLYATQENNKGILGIVSLDGRVTLRIPAKEGDVQEPAWSPYLG